MCPVDHVARTVIASALHPPVAPIGVVQITGHPRLSFNQFLGALQVYGYKVPQVDYVAWAGQLERYVNEPADQQQETEQHALMPLYHFVTADLPASTRAPELSDLHAVKALKSDAEWTGVDKSAGAGVTEEIMGAYLAYLTSTGFLAKPAETGKPLPDLGASDEQKKALGQVGGRGQLV